MATFLSVYRKLTVKYKSSLTFWPVCQSLIQELQILFFLQVELQSLSTLEPLHFYMTVKYNENTAISWFKYMYYEALINHRYKYKLRLMYTVDIVLATTCDFTI